MRPDPLENVTHLLRQAVANPDEADALPAERAEAIARLADALRKRRQRQRWRRWLPALAAAIVVLAIGGAFASRRHPPVVASRGSAQDLGRLEPADEPVAEGTELRTSVASDAIVRFASGTHVTIAGGSRVRLVEQTRTKRFALDEGSLTAKVAKLQAGERFVVDTSDAEIEVRGTAFRVSIEPGDPACGNGTPTHLDVTEGVVTVRHAGVEARVAAGEHWPTCTAPVVAFASSAPVTAPPPPSPSAKTRPPVASSRLAEQNDLFDDAMRRKRAGDVAGAISQLDRLLASYPTGPLAESAAAERRRLLSDAGAR